MDVIVPLSQTSYRPTVFMYLSIHVFIHVTSFLILSSFSQGMITDAYLYVTCHFSQGIAVLSPTEPGKAAKIETKAREKVEVRLEVRLAMNMDQTESKNGDPMVRTGDLKDGGQGNKS